MDITRKLITLVGVSVVMGMCLILQAHNVYMEIITVAKNMVIILATIRYQTLVSVITIMFGTHKAINAYQKMNIVKKSMVGVRNQMGYLHVSVRRTIS